MFQEQYDCVVMGAGPAGCTTATLVAEQGFATLLVEREVMPRFHVGESLMPETYWTLDRIGVLSRLEESCYVQKVGVQFVGAGGRESAPFYFREHDPRPCAQTWHVDRASFDKMLFDNAADKGVACHDGVSVEHIELNGPPHRVRLKRAGEVQEVKARVLVDATGQHSLIARRLGLRVVNPDLKKAAIWTHYRGAQRAEPGSEVTTILHTNQRESWFWYIPLADDLVSVGVVGDNDYLLKGRGGIEAAFAEELEKCPVLQERLEGATRCQDLRVDKEFSYTTRQQCGDGWVLVGDAFGFIDPTYSTGVFLALRSGELAADAIVDGLQRGDISAAQLGRWTEDFAEGVTLFRKLVHAFYDDRFSFAGFLRRFPQHRGNLIDLLIGRAFTPDAGRIFEDLDSELELQA